MNVPEFGNTIQIVGSFTEAEVAAMAAVLNVAAIVDQVELVSTAVIS